MEVALEVGLQHQPQYRLLQAPVARVLAADRSARWASQVKISLPFWV